jgi:hypothetical protein
VSRVDAEHHDAGQKVRIGLRDDRQDEARPDHAAPATPNCM